jgi:hypothetical protein
MVQAGKMMKQSYQSRGKVQYLGEMIIASLKVPQ